jgi:hypothetical protein
VDLLAPLAFHSLHRFGTLKTLAAPVHLRIYVSNSVLELFYLFQFAVQFLLQLAVPMHFGAEAVVSEAGQSVVHPVHTPVVVVEDAHALCCCRRRFLWRDAVLRHGRDIHPAWVNVVTTALALKSFEGLVMRAEVMLESRVGSGFETKSPKCDLDSFW